MLKVGSEIGTYEARTHFSELLERVENGEEVTITRHGRPIARVVPVRAKRSVDERLEVVERFLERSKGNKLRGLRIKDMIAEGRR